MVQVHRIKADVCVNESVSLPHAPLCTTLSAMRMLMKIQIPVEKGNEVMKNGTLGATMQSILGSQKPEAAYFTTNHGNRGGFLVVDMNDVSEMAKFAEPWFLAFNASVNFSPVMTPEDLGKAGSSIDEAVKKYA